LYSKRKEGGNETVAQKAANSEMKALPMLDKKISERAEFPLVFLLSTIAGLVAFLLVWFLGTAWELTAVM